MALNTHRAPLRTHGAYPSRVSSRAARLSAWARGQTLYDWPKRALAYSGAPQAAQCTAARCVTCVRCAESMSQQRVDRCHWLLRYSPWTVVCACPQSHSRARAVCMRAPVDCSRRRSHPCMCVCACVRSLRLCVSACAQRASWFDDSGLRGRRTDGRRRRAPVEVADVIHPKAMQCVICVIWRGLYIVKNPTLIGPNSSLKVRVHPIDMALSLLRNSKTAQGYLL